MGGWVGGWESGAASCACVRAPPRSQHPAHTHTCAPVRARSFRLASTWYFDLSIDGLTLGSVFSNGSGVNLGMDGHRSGWFGWLAAAPGACCPPLTAANEMLQPPWPTCSPTWTWGWARGRSRAVDPAPGARMQVGAARMHVQHAARRERAPLADTRMLPAPPLAPRHHQHVLGADAHLQVCAHPPHLRLWANAQLCGRLLGRPGAPLRCQHAPPHPHHTPC